MSTLPVRFLTDEDVEIYGSLKVSLGKLARSGIPVAEDDGRFEVSGRAFFDPLEDDVVIDIDSGKLEPADSKRICEIVNEANKTLFIPHVYHWILESGVKLVGLSPYTPPIALDAAVTKPITQGLKVTHPGGVQTAAKVLLDLSEGLIVEREVDGAFVDSEKIKDLDELTFKVVESANTFPRSPILLKLGRVLEPALFALDFARHKKGLNNIHMVIPFLHNTSEFMQIKRELATRNLMRKHSLKIWLELGFPENIINLEEYLLAGLDGVVLNLDQLIGSVNGFDPGKPEENIGLKKEVNGMMKFLEDGVRLLHQSEVPFIAYGEVSLYPEVLDFLVEKGVYGIIVNRVEAPSMKELLHQAEKKMILRKSS